MTTNHHFQGSHTLCSECGHHFNAPVHSVPKRITTSYGITIRPEAIAARAALFAKADREMERQMEAQAK